MNFLKKTRMKLGKPFTYLIILHQTLQGKLKLWQTFEKIFSGISTKEMGETLNQET